MDEEDDPSCGAQEEVSVAHLVEDLAVSVAGVVVLEEAVPLEDGEMMTLAQRFLTSEEQTKVTERVRIAESQTSGEIVPMIVSISYDYPKARILATLFFSIPLALVLCYCTAALFWTDPKNVYLFLALLAPLFICIHYLLGCCPVVYRLFISDAEMETEVKEEAVKSFFNEQLHRTNEANGVLLFISVFERKAWILTDFGVQEKISDDAWKKIIDNLTIAIRNGNRCKGLCHAIDEIGCMLKRHFPHRHDDKNELHNLIISG